MDFRLSHKVSAKSKILTFSLLNYDWEGFNFQEIIIIVLNQRYNDKTRYETFGSCPFWQYIACCHMLLLGELSAVSVFLLGKDAWVLVRGFSWTLFYVLLSFTDLVMYLAALGLSCSAWDL